MLIAFLVAFGLLSYTYVGYPCLLWLLARAWGRSWVSLDAVPGVTIVVAAHQEAQVIREKLVNFLEIDYPQDRLSLLVVSDASTDGTDEIIKDFPCPRVTLIRQEPRQGKPAALGLALEHVDSEIVVFTDANVMFEPPAVRRLVRPFADADVKLVTGVVHLVDRRVGFAESEGVYYRYERFIQRHESTFWSVVGVDGALYAARRESIRPPPPNAVIDDFVLSMEAVKGGGRIVFEPDAEAFEDAAASLREEFRRKTRVATGAFQSIRNGWGIPGLRSSRLLFSYVSHKLLRWLAPWLLLVLFASNLWLASGSVAWQVILGGQLLFYSMGLAGLLLPPMRPLQAFAVPMYFLLMNAAFARGFLLAVAGRDNVKWKPTARTQLKPQ